MISRGAHHADKRGADEMIRALTGTGTDIHPEIETIDFSDGAPE